MRNWKWGPICIKKPLWTILCGISMSGWLWENECAMHESKEKTSFFLPLSEADSVLVLCSSQARKRPPLQVKAAAQFVHQGPAQRAGSSFPLLSFSSLPCAPFLLLLATRLHGTVFKWLRLVGFLWQVGALLIIQVKANWQVLGAASGFRVGSAWAHTDANAHRNAHVYGPTSTATDSTPLLHFTDLRCVDFMQQLLQPHAPLEVLKCPTLVMHQLSMSYRPLPKRGRKSISIKMTP